MIILMGIVGAGKGTQAEMLVAKNGYTHVSSGELLRQYADEDQQRRLREGVLLSDEELYAIIDKAFAETPDLQKCILDGVPRTIAQADWLLSQVAQGRFEITAVIHITASEDVVLKRLLNRARSDDTEAGIAKRFEVYRNSVLPIIEHLKNKGVHVYSVNGDQEPDAVHNDIVHCLA
jgi:adenylate kinase